MAVNSSSSVADPMYHCFNSQIGVLISNSLVTIKSLIILPLSIFILHLGHQQWRQQRSSVTMSHSDIFTYHEAVMELFSILGSIFYFCGFYMGVHWLVYFGIHWSAVSFPGEVFLNTLTCVERYLAVIHPIIYLRLRRSGGVRVRNISIGCAWLACCGWVGVTAVYMPDIPYGPFLSFLVCALLLTSFCSFSVLCALIRPGPGEGAGGRKRVDQSKMKAFHTIMAIMVVQLVFFLGVLITLSVELSRLLSPDEGCIVLMSGNWFSLPTGLVLPLQYLHRTGKLFCCRK